MVSAALLLACKVEEQSKTVMKVVTAVFQTALKGRTTALSIIAKPVSTLPDAISRLSTARCLFAYRKGGVVGRSQKQTSARSGVLLQLISSSNCLNDS